MTKPNTDDTSREELDKVIATYLEGLHEPNDDPLYNHLRADRDTKALKEAIDQHTKTMCERAVEVYQQKRITENKSFCGCPMCLHHTEPYEAELQSSPNKREDSDV